MNYGFESENLTNTSIGEVTTDISSDNGFGAITTLFKSFGSAGYITKDGTVSQEGVTTTCNSYNNTSTGTPKDTLTVSQALADYRFFAIQTEGGNANFSDQLIPNWCNYIKVFLIGGGGGGAKPYDATFATFAGTGGGCGQLVVAGIEVNGGSKFTVNLGHGGAPSSGDSLAASDGEHSKFSIQGTNITVQALGGKGGWAAWHAPGFAGYGLGGGQATRDQDHVDHNSSGNIKKRIFYSGNSGSRKHTYYQNTGYLINPGGAGFARKVQDYYNFYSTSASSPRNSNNGIVQEMRVSYMLRDGYGIGGDGQASGQALAREGLPGCCCVFFFPSRTSNPLVNIPASNWHV